MAASLNGTLNLPYTPKPAPMVLDYDSWQARLVRKVEQLHKLGKPSILIVKLGDCTPNWLRTVNDGRG